MLPQNTETCRCRKWAQLLEKEVSTDTKLCNVNSDVFQKNKSGTMQLAEGNKAAFFLLPAGISYCAATPLLEQDLLAP